MAIKPKKDELISLTPGTVELLQEIAPHVGSDPKQHAEVIRKAIRLLNLVKKNKVVVSTQSGDYKLNLKYL